ncbi:MAG: hypothetical protein LBV72_01995 [Tannerella sp.]|jgi:hypothetical protein|nr:hypothetical protein [Tannerella sp.]
MNFQLKQSERKKAKIKMALKGCSSSGKSMSALFIAKGLCNGDMGIHTHSKYVLDRILCIDGCSI